MGKFIIGTFLLLGFGFYELSGGNEFVPETRPVVVAEVTTTELEPLVTRADTSSLVTLASVEVTAPQVTVIEETVAPEVMTPEVVAEVAPVVEEVIEEPIDLRTVAGSRVNMRAGPGTNYNVLDSLVAGTWAEVLEVDASGWARIRNMDTGQEGWMAERFLAS